MQKLVNADVENGNILSRDKDEMATTIRSYIAIRDKIENKIVGFIALYIYNTQLAEVRSLIVHKDYRGKGIAKQLISKSINEAKELKLKQLLVLTYKQKLFESFKFIEIKKELIPETKIWIDCSKCKHFDNCDEISLILDI